MKQLRIKAYLSIVVSFLFMSAMFFLPAGTLDYWEAWVYLAVMFIPIIAVTDYLIENDPALLERRMRFKEKQPKQKLIMGLSYFYFTFLFLLPGFDRRYGWSHVPVILVVIADLMVLLGYYMFFIVLKENPFASRIVEITPGQKVITTGLYAIVRHPMYLAGLLIFLFSPLALGSFWTIIPALITIPILVARILDEERMLSKDLKGYREYMEKTHYRLIPGVW
ncbi:MAG: isoprenylcysteine carboxylmethyltransferase family protein [Rubrobacteridae bacterium]|nr:isoprenylcysteine carboxylmethyltransferase family protein [Rubrobacteridae bacterium]